MKDEMKINVLGTEYDVELLEQDDESMKLLNCVGYTDNTVKQIKIKNQRYKDASSKENAKYDNDITLRHELIHAFLYECGIDLNMRFHTEECVDFFAIQFPKLAKIFKDAGCLDDGKDLDSFRKMLKKHHRVE